MYFYPSPVYTLSTGNMLRLLDLNFSTESRFVILRSGPGRLTHSSMARILAGHD